MCGRIAKVLSQQITKLRVEQRLTEKNDVLSSKGMSNGAVKGASVARVGGAAVVSMQAASSSSSRVNNAASSSTKQ